ncbi:MAG: UvrB/UvrC motif-containing protein [Clostridia bacterium]|nr:UvrB/UvrC motif-containing protein [Clostridia bacterium]MBR3954132.1 UvrB/UvrC motif-containing protein [Clostridia bacterium]
MLCRHCSKKEATTHIRSIIGGETVETHLCAECAAVLGYTDVFPMFAAGLSDFMFGALRNDAAVSSLSSKIVRCENCGASFEEIANSGAPSCPACYRVFYDKFLPTVQRIHGNTSHIGKVAGGADEDVKRAHRISLLKEQLNTAIDERNFELASRLRDEIRELEGRRHG